VKGKELVEALRWSITKAHDFDIEAETALLSYIEKLEKVAEASTSVASFYYGHSALEGLNKALTSLEEDQPK
jgi:hypothetical protein